MTVGMLKWITKSRTRDWTTLSKFKGFVPRAWRQKSEYTNDTFIKDDEKSLKKQIKL